MPVTIEKFAIATELMAKGLLNLRSANLKLCLLNKDYTPDTENHEKLEDLRKSLVDGVANNWIVSGSGTNEYYYNQSDLTVKPGAVYENGVAMDEGTLGSLAAGEWAWGDNDSLGSSKLYVRLDSATADPDGNAAGFVKSSCEVNGGVNYTAGGAAVGSPTVTRDGYVVTLDGDDVTFTALDAAIKYGILYYDETLDSAGPDEIVKPLLAVINFDNTGASSVLNLSEIDFMVPWHADGILVFGPCVEVCE